MALDGPSNYEEAMEAYEELIESFQEIHHRISTVENFNEPNVVESIIDAIEAVLNRYDALE